MPFYSPEGLSNKERHDAATRRFIGDGTPYLKVPDLVRHRAVRVGTTVVPEMIEAEIPTDNTLTRVAPYREPGVVLLPDDDGESVLYRSTLSNDGIWQAGAPVFVTGEWQPAPAGKAG